MIRTARQVFRVQSAMSCNRFLFWAKKLPLVKRLFPDRLYGAAAAKGRLMAAVEALKILYAFAGKFVYLFLCCLLPVMLSIGMEPSLGRGWPRFLTVLFFLSFITGCFLASDVLTATLVKFTCVRQMGMEARTCAAATSGRLHLLTFLSFTPALVTAAVLLDQPWWVGLLLSVELAACRLLGEFLHVCLFDKTGKIPSRNPWYVVIFILAGLFLAYGPLLADVTAPVDRVLTHPAVTVLILALGGLSAVWLLRYPRYPALIRAVCKPETLTAAASGGAKTTFKDVQMRSSDLTAEAPGGRISSLRGYEYLNALFFRRHRRLLARPVKLRLIGVGLAFGAGAVCAILLRDPTAAVLAQLPRLLPACVFLMYALCNGLGQRICKAMFFNCDLSLLRYGWYRQRDVVLKNFAIRLRRVAGLNLLVAAAICAGVALLALLSGAVLPPGELVPFLLCILCLAVLFSVHPLFMYYIFQPYTAALAVKNPFFGIINYVMYLACFLCLQVKQPPEGFALLVLGVTLAYTAAALTAVWKRAPKTFRVK